jgi:hypothetical protein
MNAELRVISVVEIGRSSEEKGRRLYTKHRLIAQIEACDY